MVQVLYLLEVFILANYGPPSTETPNTLYCNKYEHAVAESRSEISILFVVF